MSYPPALFSYAWAPADVPCRDSTPSLVVLMLTVTNSTGKDVSVDQIGFTLTQGDDGAHLTSDLAGVNTAVAAGTTWSFNPLGGAAADPVQRSFVAAPPDADPLFRNDTSVAFLLKDVPVNAVPGGVDVLVFETTSDGTTRQCATRIVKMPAGLGITELSAAPVQVDPGKSSILTWKTTGATTCTLSDGEKTVPMGLSGSQPVSPEATTRYTLSAEGGGTTTTADVWITVPEVRILDFRATPDHLASGDTTTLSWLVLGANEATITPGDHTGLDPASGSLPVPVSESTRFSLQASSPARSASQDKDVTVPPVAITSFEASSAVVAPGNAATLSWVVEWASACTIDQGIGSVDRKRGSKDVTPATTTTYQLTAAGCRPQQRSVTIGVGAAIATFGCQADPAKPKSVVLTWNTVVEPEGKVTMVVNGGNPAGVAPFGTKPIDLPDGLLEVQLHVDGPTTHAVATLDIPRPLITPDGQLTQLLLTCPPGINAVGATAQVQWTAKVGTVTGTVTNAQGATLPIDGATGSSPFGLGVRAPGTPLWQGDLQIGTGPMVHFEIA